MNITGYTQIENIILEKIYSLRLTGGAFAVLLMIIRYTAGFHRNDCEMSYTYIQRGTNLSRSTVRNAVKKLLEIGIIYETECPQANKGRRIGICREFFVENNEEKTEKTVLEKTDIKENSLYNDGKEIAEKETAGEEKKEIAEEHGGEDREINGADFDKDAKKPMGIFRNVMLCGSEYELLKKKYGEKTDNMIDNFSAKLKSKGYSYKDHYAAIILWQLEDKGKEEEKLRKAKEKELEKGFDTDEFFNIALNAAYKKLHDLDGVRGGCSG